MLTSYNISSYLTHKGKSKSSTAITHGDIPTHRYNTASRAIAFLQLQFLLSIFVLGRVSNQLQGLLGLVLTHQRPTCGVLKI